MKIGKCCICTYFGVMIILSDYCLMQREQVFSNYEYRDENRLIIYR